MRLRLCCRSTLRCLAVAAAVLISGIVVHSDPADPTPGRGAMANETALVKTLTRREGNATRVSVQNSELSEITMTFEFSVVNLKGSVEFPYTATFKPGKTEAFTMSPVDPDVPWQYSYTNYYKLGSCVAEPDGYIYSLPYAPGKSYRVTQGYNGKFSHTGSNQYATDWQMPQGTPVLAARGGRGVKVRDDSDRGGSSVKFDPFNNYVLIRHSDGTLGHYCHLKKGGAKVKPGDIVNTGDVIALSGNTGYSSGAHLHFSVFKTRNGRERVSIPVKFTDATGEVVTLVEGRKYAAAALPAKVNATPAPGAVSALP
jgi:murein DD-endopeptidase MepM/ murein hydrolase activator NlpD